MHILSKDPVVIALGQSYMQIAGYAYLLQVFSATLSSVLKATANTRIPMIASIFSVITNIILDIIKEYQILYYGKGEIFMDLQLIPAAETDAQTMLNMQKTCFQKHF